MTGGRMVVGLALLQLAGCASVSVHEIQESRKRIPQKAPPVLYVMDFGTEDGEFNVDREGEALRQFKRETARELSGILIERLTRHVGVADRLTEIPKGPMEGWLITGRFLRVNQGSRALRMGVGFGAGGTKLETEVSVYDLSISATRPFMRFQTTGGSNAEPGVAMRVGTAVLTGGPAGVLSAGPTLAGQGMKGLTEDSNRTGRMIAAALSQYMANRGWISPEKALRPKEPFQTEVRRLSAASVATTNAPSPRAQPSPAANTPSAAASPKPAAPPPPRLSTTTNAARPVAATPRASPHRGASKKKTPPPTASPASTSRR